MMPGGAIAHMQDAPARRVCAFLAPIRVAVAPRCRRRSRRCDQHLLQQFGSFLGQDARGSAARQPAPAARMSSTSRSALSFTPAR